MFSFLKSILKKNQKIINKELENIFSDSEEEAISYFCKTLSQEQTGDNFISINKTLTQTRNEKISIIILGTKVYFSSNIIKKLNILQDSDIPISIHIDRTISRNNELYTKLKNSVSKNIEVYYYSRSVTTYERLKKAIENTTSEYVLILTLSDFINARSISKLKSVVKLITIDKTPNAITYLNLNDLYNSLTEPDFSGLSSIIYNRTFLIQCLNKLNFNFDFHIGYFLYSFINKDNIFILDKEIPFSLSIKPKDISVLDISYFIRDSIYIIKNIENVEKFNIFINIFYKNILQIINTKKLSRLKYIILTSGISILFSHIYEKKITNDEEFRTIVYKFSSLFNFDSICKEEKTQQIHQYIIQKINKINDNTIGICETDFMQDINEHLLPKLSKNFKVKYISKPQYYDFHFFFCMIASAYFADCKFIVTSNDIHKFISSGKKVITLWHGLGMLKKIAKVNRNIYPMDKIVTSSQDCIQSWSETFKISVENVLPLGSFQTDILYNTEYKLKKYNEIRNFYKIPLDATVVFFAPTFRIKNNEKYYDFQINIDDLSIELAKHNIYIVTKVHHVFKHILKDKGINKSGVYTSFNNHFIVDTNYSFTELLVSANQFMSDYSSGIFYAYILNYPIILYAPDYKDYLISDNGFMINYPNDIAGNYVLQPSITNIIQAIKKPYPVNSDFYQKFKKIHVGACDGHVSERIIKMLQNEKSSL